MEYTKLGRARHLLPHTGGIIILAPFAIEIEASKDAEAGTGSRA